MATGLPRRLDVPRLADQQAELDGSLPLADLPRVRAMLAEASGAARVWMRFGRDPVGRVVVSGRVQAELRLTCQRCLEPVTVAVEAAPQLMVVADEEAAAAVPEGYEPLLLTGREAESATLVEDELLLAVPIVPVHDDTVGCGTGARREPAPDPQGARRNPFAVLAGLKERN